MTSHTISCFLTVMQRCSLLLLLGRFGGGDPRRENVLLETSMEVEGGVRAVLMDFGSARPAAAGSSTCRLFIRRPRVVRLFAAHVSFVYSRST